MIRIVRTATLADLRAAAGTADENLRQAGAAERRAEAAERTAAGFRCDAEDAERRTAAAKSEAGESINRANITIGRQHQRISELTEALQLAEAERNKLRNELDDVLREREAAAFPPELSREELLNSIVIEVNTSSFPDEWWDLDYSGRQSAIKAEVARIKAPAAEKLAPLIRAMAATRLIEAGFKVALASDLRHPSPYGSTAHSAVDRLKMARERIYSTAVDPLLLPDTVLIYDHTRMPLIGDPDATDIDQYDSKWDIQ